MKTLGKFMELFWLVLGVVALAVVLYHTSQTSFDETRIYFLAPALCFAMFFFRKFMNGKLQKMAELEEQRRREQTES